jgi:hypothetical protein
VPDAADADAALRNLSLLRDGPARGAILVRVDEVSVLGHGTLRDLRPSQPFGDCGALRLTISHV